MIRKLFGTDGIRGKANEEPMTAPTALRVAMATAKLFRRGEHRHRVVIGKDTRLSGYMLEPALTAGFIAQGMNVVLLGPVPTPAVAMLTKSLRADIGVMISASHNLYEDNGIKLFGPDGYKLSDEIEAKIEDIMEDEHGLDLPPSDKLGKASRLDDALGRYVEHVKATFPQGLRLDGMKIVVDCANGAAYKVAPTVLWELGAEVIPVAVAPDGRNINRQCGATSTMMMQEAVVLHQANVGIALDGDADRLIMADEKGNVIDGDQLIGLVASSWHEMGRLRTSKIVTTLMSNLGLERFLKQKNIEMLRTAVGDRYVVEAMREQGCNLGGEQSGHIVLSDYSTTGDGLLAALQVLAVLQQKGLPASEVCRVFEPVPQILRNIRATGSVLQTPAVIQEVDKIKGELEGKGRIVLRKSGTEPLIRLMLEGDSRTEIEALADRLEKKIKVSS